VVVVGGGEQLADGRKEETGNGRQQKDSLTEKLEGFQNRQVLCILKNTSSQSLRSHNIKRQREQLYSEQQQ